MKTDSGNNHNWEEGYLKPTLGTLQPDEVTMEKIQADAEANRERMHLLDKQAEDNRDLAAQLEEKTEELDRREAEFLRREKDLRKREAAVATDRNRE